MATQPNLTDEQRANLAKLAAYLRSLPVNYRHFDMRDFTTAGEYYAHLPECGTAACAVGHAPNAGFEPHKGEDWWEYSERFFIPDYESDAWQWCFGSGWSLSDNTARGAADRIDWLLANGVPPDAYEQMSGRVPLSYQTGAL